MMKKISTFFLLLLSILSLVACQNSQVDSSETYTVTFALQGHGNAIDSQLVEKGKYATKPTDPSATGYEFGGWYKEASCENGFDFLTDAITANTTIYAKWSAITKTSFTVEFIMQGHGEAPATQTIEAGNLVVKPADPNVAGYRFEGWYKDISYINPFDFTSEIITSDTKLYAKWSLVTDKKTTIYLVGDSTVQSYDDKQFIAGWGQYLDLFLTDDIEVINAAKGGRSSRSFINEDRLFASSDATYTFSENGGKAIEETIQPGDFLFIQFGHNDDATKGYTTMPNRMVPLGEPDENGIYPTTAPTGKKPTSYLPPEYLAAANESEKEAILAELAKYGSDYYAYGDGTYKWYLKQYIDLARKKGAIPVLMTPVARVAFNADGALKDGPGLHGDNFAYVEAVRQLANEENCLLIDNFAFTKNLIETATKDYADFLMALVPNDFIGSWPSDYDNWYNNPEVGFEKIEATHYNKYGAYLVAAYVAETILNQTSTEVIKGLDKVEYFNFASYVLTNPKEYVDPSNRISISMVSKLENLLKVIKVTNPKREYMQASVVIEAINDLATKLGDIDTAIDNGTIDYEEWSAQCADVRNLYNQLNYDLRSEVTNLTLLEKYEAAAEASRPKPSQAIVFNADLYVNNTIPITVANHTFTFASDLEATPYLKASVNFEYNGESYDKTSQAIKLNGNSSNVSKRYVEFTVEKACSITIVAQSGGSDTRTVQLGLVENGGTTIVATASAEATQTLTTMEVNKGGTYRIGSLGSNISLFYIIIEYYD